MTVFAMIGYLRVRIYSQDHIIFVRAAKSKIWPVYRRGEMKDAYLQMILLIC